MSLDALLLNVETIELREETLLFIPLAALLSEKLMLLACFGLNDKDERLLVNVLFRVFTVAASVLILSDI